MKTLMIVSLSVALSVAISVPATLALGRAPARAVTTAVKTPSYVPQVMDEYENWCDPNARVAPFPGGPLICPASLHFTR